MSTPIRVLYTGMRQPESPDDMTLFHLPALKFRPLALPVADIVYSLESSDAVCVYSVRGVDAIASEPRVRSAIRQQGGGVYCVGERTSAAWREQIDAESTPVVCRTFADLVSNVGPDDAVRWVTAFELQDGPRTLYDQNIPQIVDAFEVYATSRRTPSSREWGSVESFDPEWVAFTSPRGVAGMQEYVRRLPSARIAAIGGTTTAALQRDGFVVHAVAERPLAEALLEAIAKESR